MSGRQISKKVVVDALGGILRHMDEHPAVKPKLEDIDLGSLGSYDPDPNLAVPFDSLSPSEKDAVEAEAYHAMYSKGPPPGEVSLEERRSYYARCGVKAAHLATIVSPENCKWMMKKLRSRIVGKVVVEIGAGFGILAIEMAKAAKRVFAIEADPYFTAEFSRVLYKDRPINLTWIFDTAQGVLESGLGESMRADVAVVVTGSDEDGLRRLARRFVRTDHAVIMPWQDWNGGRAYIDCCKDEAPNPLHHPWPEITLPK